MTRAARTLASLAVALALAACARDEPPAPTPPAASTTVAGGDTELTVSLDRDDARTVDRVHATITLRRPVAAPVTLVEPDWAAANWTVIDTADAPPRALTHDRIERARTVTLEPFLPGDYEIPPIAVHLPDGTSLVSQPLPLTVRTVLAPDDAGALAPARTAMPAPKRHEPESRALPVAIVVAVTAAFLLIRVARRPHAIADPTESALARLQRIASGSPNDAHTLADVHRALESLPPADRRHIATLIARCERARFAPDSHHREPSDDPRTIAAEAQRLISTPSQTA